MRKPSYASSSSSFLRCIQGKSIFVTVPQMLTASLLHFCLPKKNHHNFNLCFSAFSSTGTFSRPSHTRRKREESKDTTFVSLPLFKPPPEREEGPFPNHHRQREIVEELFKHSRGCPLSLWPAKEGGIYAAKGPHPTPPPSFGLTDTHRRRTEDGRRTKKSPLFGKKRARSPPPPPPICRTVEREGDISRLPPPPSPLCAHPTIPLFRKGWKEEGG